MVNFKRILLLFLNSKNKIHYISLKNLQSKYSKTYLGIFWFIIRQIFFILVFWFVFSFGIKSKGAVEGYIFIAYFLTGYVPWIFFTESLGGFLGCFTANKSLIERAVIKPYFIPLTVIYSNLIIHFVFLTLTIIFLNWHLTSIKIDYISLILLTFYYAFFILSFGSLLSLLSFYIKDVSVIVLMGLQFLFWIMPIFWSYESINHSIVNILEMNPLLFFFDAHRSIILANESLINVLDINFIYSLIFNLIVIFLIVVTFKKTRTQFYDEL